MRKRKPVLLNGEALMVDGKVLEFDAVNQEELDGKIDAPQVAQVGEVLTVEEVDAEGKPTRWKTAPAAAEQKQADWNQNDETAADYVKNRPFYVADEAPLGEVVFTARSVNAITHTVNAMSMKVLRAISSTTGTSVPRPQIRLFLCGKFYAVNVYFDRGNFSFTSDEISGHVNYNAGREWYFEVKDNSVSFTVGESYSVAFFDINNKGCVKIPLEYFPDSIFTQESAPVRYGDGNSSTIQGTNTTASGDNSHAEGGGTVASGESSHAEGNITTAAGLDSHAEGFGTKASGDYSHAEGFETIASGDKQHVQGDRNISDTTSAHIVGNGTPKQRSNAHTLDWKGNAWFAGDVYVHSTSGTNKDEGSVKLATEDQLTSCVRLSIRMRKNGDGTITYFTDFPALFVYYEIFKGRPIDDGNSVECCLIPIESDSLTVLNYTGMSIDQNSDGNIVLAIRFSSYTSGKQISAEIKDTISGFETDNEKILSTVVTVTENAYLLTPTTAQVGQIVKVKAVDADGKITETETVDIGSGIFEFWIEGQGTASSPYKLSIDINDLYSALNKGLLPIAKYKLSTYGSYGQQFITYIYDSTASIPGGSSWLYFSSIGVGNSLASQFSTSTFIIKGDGIISYAEIDATRVVIPQPSTANPDQIIRVKSVDESGKITETETVNIPTIPQPFGGNKMIATEQIGENEFGYTLRPIPTINDFIALGITSAQVGQIIKVKAVDDFGNPHEWEAVDMPTQKTLKWITVHSSDLTEETTEIVISTDSNGKTIASYNPVGLTLVLSTPADSTQTDNNGAPWIYPSATKGDNVIRVIGSIAGWKTTARDNVFAFYGGSSAMTCTGNQNTQLTTYKIDGYLLDGVKAMLNGNTNHFPVGTHVEVSILCEV